MYLVTSDIVLRQRGTLFCVLLLWETVGDLNNTYTNRIMWSKLAIFVCIFNVGLAVTTYQCPRGITSSQYAKVFGKNCYHFIVYQKKDFLYAQIQCKRHGGNLALVKNKEINNFIGDTLENTYDVHSSPVWIGLQYSGSDNSYRWVDGSSLGQYNNIKERDSYDGEDCVAINPRSRVWYGYKCETNYWQLSLRKMFICEYPAVPIILATPRSTTVLKVATTTPPLPTKTTMTIPILTTTKSPKTNTATPPSTTNTTKPSDMTKTVPPTSTTTNPSRTMPSHTATTKLSQVSRTFLTRRTTTSPSRTMSPLATMTKPQTTSKRSLASTTMPIAMAAQSTVVTAPIKTTTENKSRVKTTCPVIVCELDCGMTGLKQDPETKCVICKCDE